MQTSWPSGELIGVQEPRIGHRPWSLESWTGPIDFEAGETALDLADIAGRRRPPWQDTVVREGMARNSDGKWAAFEVGCLVSRQNGKNGCIEVVELGWMVNEPGVKILHTAHKFTTALESMERLISLIKGDPKIAGLIARGGIRRGNGRESITFTNGSFIAFRTRTNQGGRGESFDRLVIDEAMILSAAAYAALEPLLTTADQPGSSGPGGQIWYLGSAPDADEMEHCGHWATLRDRAFEREPSLLWLEWSAPEPPEDATQQERAAWRADRRNWAAANPSLGYLITEAYIEKTLRSARNSLDKWEIERLSLGRWPKPFEEDDPVVDMNLWGQMAEQNPTVRGPIALALDMTPDLQVCALGAATYTTSDRIRLELGYHGSPTDIVERVADLVDRWDPCVVVINSSSPAASLVPKLRALGIEPELTTAGQAADAVVGFVDDALAGRISHAGDDRVEEALATVRKRELGGGRFGWDYTSAGATRMQVVTQARWGLLTFGPMVRPRQAPVQDELAAAEIDSDALMGAGF